MLLALVAASAVAAGVAVALDRPGAGQGRAFQRATGGIGLGPAVSPAWSFFLIDPRTESYCENELWPVPGIPCYSPYHGALIADPPPLPRAAGPLKTTHSPRAAAPASNRAQRRNASAPFLRRVARAAQ